MAQINERHRTILEYLNQNGQVDTAYLTEILNTSRETVRRDLNALATQGLLLKTYGGAVALTSTEPGLYVPLSSREQFRQGEKQALCALAAEFIQEYDTVFIDNSTTTSHLIKYAPKHCKVTFITNSIQLLAQFAQIHNPRWNVISLGGTLDYETSSTNRFLAMNNLQHFKPNKAFISCHGIDDEFCVTDTDINDVEIKQYIINTCKETYLLVDASKLPRQGVVKIDDSANFHCIITNESIDPLFLSQLNYHDCKIRLASPIHP